MGGVDRGLEMAFESLEGRTGRRGMSRERRRGRRVDARVVGRRASRRTLPPASPLTSHRATVLSSLHE